MAGTLVALAVPPGPGFVDALRRTWDDGDAALPVDLRLPSRARRDLLDALAPGAVRSDDGRTGRGGGRPVAAGDALVVATSGTTGEPKGVVLTHAAVMASARITSAALDVDPDRDHWLACLPPAHIGGLSVITRALHTGTRLTAQPGVDPEAIAAAARNGANLVSLVVTTLRRVDPTPFRRILLGGSAIPSDRPVNTVATYGSTETGSGIVYDGHPLDDVELRVVDGEIHVRSPTLLRSYRDGTDPKDPEGWFPTGDGGVLHPDGRLEVHGRLADVIVTGAEKVWPAAVTPLIEALDSVREATVVGRPDPEWGQRVTAIVAPEPGLTPPTLADLRAALADRLPRYALPRSLELVDALPRTTSGKVDPRRLT